MAIDRLNHLIVSDDIKDHELIMVKIVKARQLLRAGKFADSHEQAMELKKDIMDPNTEENPDKIQVFIYFEYQLVLKKVLYK